MDNQTGTKITPQLNTEIRKLKENDYTSYQNFYNETSPYLYGIIWDKVQDQNSADELLNKLYTDIYASIGTELADNNQFYAWAANKAQTVTTTYLMNRVLDGANKNQEEHPGDKVVAAAMANAGIDAATGAGMTGGSAAYGAGEAGIGSAAYGAGQAGIGSAAYGAGQAGFGTAAGMSGVGTAAGTGIASGVAHAGLSIGAKIAIGIAASAVVVGGSIGLAHVISNKNEKEPSTVEQASEETEEVSTDQDLVTDTVEVADANPVLDGYCFERVTDDEDIGNVQGYIDYYKFIGDSTPALKSGFETWQKEILDGYYSSRDEYGSYELYDFVDNYTIDAALTYNRADTRILSVSYYEYAYVGGAHGYGGVTSTNFDAKTGKILTLDDIGDVKGDIKTAILNDFSQNGYSTGGGLFPEWETTIDTEIADNTLDWGMTYDCLYVQFDQYEIAPYAAGMFRIEIPYSELPGMKSEYLPEEDIFLDAIGSATEYYDDSTQYDIDGDGTTDSVSVYLTYGEENEKDSLHLEINGTAVTEEFTYEQYNATLYSTAEGKTYAILELVSTDACSDYYIYDITSKTAVEIQRFTDTANMQIGPCPVLRKTEIDVFGVYTGYKIYYFGQDGLTTDYKYYILEDTEDMVLTAKSDIPCKMEKDGKLVEGTVAVGTVIHPLECDTDNKVFVFAFDDGTRGRIMYEQNDSGISVNGVPESDIFSE